MSSLHSSHHGRKILRLPSKAGVTAPTSMRCGLLSYKIYVRTLRTLTLLKCPCAFNMVGAYLSLIGRRRGWGGPLLTFSAFRMGANSRLGASVRTITVFLKVKCSTKER